MSQTYVVKIIRTLLFLSLILFLSVPMITAADAKKQTNNSLVYVIPIEDDVERGLVAFLERSVNEAIENHADHIIFEIDTPGGRVDSASEIATLMQGVDVPTTAYVLNQALSAGSYLALNTDTIFMKPNATMGASGVITNDGNAADKKAQSAWIAAMKSAAESNGRDPLYAIAMADASVDLPKLGAPEGEFLTLTAQNAVEVGYSEGIMAKRSEVLEFLELSDATVQETTVTFVEEIARFVTNPIVIPILLSVASIGLIVELYTPGFGVAGSMGLISLGLFFYGHIIAGLAGKEVVTLLIIGVILIILEFFVSGGILGLMGIAAIIVSLFIAGYDLTQMAISISVACIVAVTVAVILFKRIGTGKGIIHKLILKDRTTTELGYTSAEDRTNLIGEIGITITDLRPSGIIEYKDERLDVVSEGAFINKGSKVVITHVEGMRIVVRELQTK